jgi:polyisoprenoid-binding protein YceI
MRHLALATLMIAGLAGHGLAAAAPDFTTDPKAVHGGNYVIEPNHTRVLFSVNHMGFTTWYGEFTGATGSLVLDPAKPSASTLDVSIPVANISTSNAKLDGELKSPAWFDAAQFPTVSFHATNVTVTGKGAARVTGALTLHGVTKTITLQAKLNGAGANPVFKTYTVGFEVSGKIHRSDFGVKAYVPVVGDDVNLIISAAFVPK